MREMDWPEPRPRTGPLIDEAGLQVGPGAPGGGVLISGDLDAALAVLAPGAPVLGLGAECPAPPFAVRIARDRALLVTDRPLDMLPGWNDAGFAATPADDQWSQVHVAGPDACEVIAEGTAADPDGGSPSAALRFAGLTCLLLRRDGGFLLFVEASQRWFLGDWLCAVAAGRPR